MKREHVLSWDEYFMGLAHLSAMRSKDPSTQVGAVIVDAEHKVVGIGYNGLPIGCSDDEFPWDREGGMLETFSMAAKMLGEEPDRCIILEDSFNGIKAAHAGGFLPVMVPDQDEPDEELSKLLTARCSSLTDVIGLFEDGTFEPAGAGTVRTT